MPGWIITHALDGLTQGLTRTEAEILRDYLFTARKPAWLALGRRVQEALDAPAGTLPLELRLQDVPVLCEVLDGAEVGQHRGLALLAQAVGAEPCA